MITMSSTLLLRCPRIGLKLVGVLVLISTVACDEVRIKTTSQSPDDKYLASFYSMSGGGAAGWVVLRVNLRRTNDVFYTSDYVFEMNHGYQCELTWKGNAHLIVTYPAEANLKKQGYKWNEVTISYEMKPSKGGMFLDKE